MTKEEIICLPAMTDIKKLRTMSLMGLLTSFCNFYSQALMQLVACELLKSSYLHGYCEDTISGLVYMSHGMSIVCDFTSYFTANNTLTFLCVCQTILGLLLYAEEVELARKINSIAETLMELSPNLHSLRAR